MKKILLIIFLAAPFLRFLFFPDNIYFGYDQARDAFAALNILKGDLKIVGPTTTFSGLNHGVLHWYILSFPYLIGAGNPEIASAFFRILNALGIFIIFYLGKILFDKKVGFITAFLLAISFEQSQFSIYLGNPALGSLSVPLMFLGLSLVIFARKNWGLILAFLGLGLSIQFQFALFYLITPFLLIIIYFRKSFLKLPAKIWTVSVFAGIVSISTFLIAEIKYGFRIMHALTQLVTSGSHKTIENIIGTYVYTINKMIEFNLTGNLVISPLAEIVLLGVFAFLLIKKDFREKIIFLGIWFFSLIITFLINGGVENPAVNFPLYYPNVGISIALLIFVAFVLYKLLTRSKVLFFTLILIIFALNIFKINQLNPKGTILEINSQPGMLLSDEKKVLDYIYQDAKGPFAVKALTMPLDINTTWSYLFEWYGQKKYGYLPTWNGKNALGYPGNLMVQEAQEGLPNKRYVIIEPLRGIPDYLVNDFLKEEGYFTKVLEEKKFGQIIVQKRTKI